MISPPGWIPEGLTCSEGFRWGGGLSTRNPLHFCQHSTGLFAGGAVDVVVAEEDLRGRSTGSAVLGHVVRTDVDGGIGGFLNEFDAGGLAVGAGDTVGLAFGDFDHQEDTPVVGEGLVRSSDGIRPLPRRRVIEGLPGDYGPWGRWGTDQHGELAVVEGAQRPEQPTSGRDLIPLYARSAARNGRKSLTGAPGAEGRVLQWSCHK